MPEPCTPMRTPKKELGDTEGDVLMEGVMEALGVLLLDLDTAGRPRPLVTVPEGVTDAEGDPEGDPDPVPVRVEDTVPEPEGVAVTEGVPLTEAEEVSEGV